MLYYLLLIYGVYLFSVLRSDSNDCKSEVSYAFFSPPKSGRAVSQDPVPLSSFNSNHFLIYIRCQPLL